VFIPYRRFRDTHFAHHRNELLTDPYDDPESNYIDPKVWPALPAWRRGLLTINNTLMGRMVVGPAVGMMSFWSTDLSKVFDGQTSVLNGWLLHLAGLVPVIWWLSMTGTSWLAYALAAYLALSILKIRTFLEHRADERAAGRSVIIEDQGPLAFLFLNNNFHAVHHAHPKVAWYQLPALYSARRDIFLRRNGGYLYKSYAAIFRDHLLRAKDPVPHPLMDE
jgi:fatty acid desaturase